MSEFKVIGGLVELGAAAKFLAITDQHFEWGVFTRDPVLGLWAALGLFGGAYLIGMVRLKDDMPVERLGYVRPIMAVLLVALGVGCLAGLNGMYLGGTIEGFFPADMAPPAA